LTGSLRLDVARTQLAWAIICRERGERARGQELLDQCRAQFRTAGCSHSLVEVQQLTSAWD
jgi:hypothetical protein